MKNFLNLFLLLSLVFFLPAAQPVKAQDESGPVYIVQEGDTLWAIALRFGVDLIDLQAANQLSDPGQIGAGARLVIPGLEGIQGVLTTEPVPFGETLRSLSRELQTPIATLARLNHLTSPDELYVGVSLILPVREDQPAYASRAAVWPGQTLLEVAAVTGQNPWALTAGNALSGTWSALPGDILRYPGEAQDGPGALPAFVKDISLSPTPAVQGQVVELQVRAPEGMSLSGSFNGSELHFFPDGAGGYVGLQGIHAMLEPGLYPMIVRGEAAEASQSAARQFAFAQEVYVTSGSYPFDPVLTVSPETIDPAVTQPEDAEWKALMLPLSPERQWSGIFQSPVPPEFSDCFPSRYGNRRSYNGSAYQYFHTGLDFCGGVGTDIFAPADGTVVFAGPLTVRGNATVIDHGWGVYTGYMHQDQILVQVGEQVSAGQLIGKVGRTGRVTGPHLHWEVMVGGVQVDPEQWLFEEFP